MLIFNKGQLWIVEWVRKFNSAQASKTVTDIPAIIKKDNIIYVSDHSISDIMHHIDNCEIRGYVPLHAIFEIYPDGMILRRCAGGAPDKPVMRTHAFDAAALTVVGFGSRAFITSLELTDGDVMAALRNTAKITSQVKPGARVTQYILPVQKVQYVEPTGAFILE